MPVIEAQRASILVPHDHRHINHDRVTTVSDPTASNGGITQAVPCSDRVPSVSGTILLRVSGQLTPAQTAFFRAALTEITGLPVTRPGADDDGCSGDCLCCDLRCRGCCYGRVRLEGCSRVGDGYSGRAGNGQGSCRSEPGIRPVAAPGPPPRDPTLRRGYRQGGADDRAGRTGTGRGWRPDLAGPVAGASEYLHGGHADRSPLLPRPR